jgi:hypothetical protein
LIASRQQAHTITCYCKKCRAVLKVYEKEKYDSMNLVKHSDEDSNLERELQKLLAKHKCSAARS